MSGEVQTFQKKPVTVEAFQLTEELAKSILFEKKKAPFGIYVGVSRNEALSTVYQAYATFADVTGQTRRADMGDWIIKDERGYLHPCEEHIFAAIYELARRPADGAREAPENEREMILESALLEIRRIAAEREPYYDAAFRKIWDAANEAIRKGEAALTTPAPEGLAIDLRDIASAVKTAIHFVEHERDNRATGESDLDNPSDYYEDAANTLAELETAHTIIRQRLSTHGDGK